MKCPKFLLDFNKIWNFSTDLKKARNIHFFLSNQPDAPIIQIYSVIKLCMFRASSLPITRSFYTVHSALVSFMQVHDDPFQAESGWNAVPS